ncbi:hypothetical protein KUL156_34920 [Alteromonas sp. KUL156]|nr:hypothetical protein KUL154_08940 [Alteromonas sp. KUL154]GFE00900.1 hypothetical protein KUL156_34920 [Alteromonas sp. KUL156]
MKDYVTFDFFDKIRKGELSEYDITFNLKKLSYDYDVEFLKPIEKDLESYLSYEKNELESSFSEEDIQTEINRAKDVGREVLYVEVPNLKSLTDEKVPKTKMRLDVENLMYPTEFILLYVFREKLRKILYQKKDPISPVPWKGKSTQLVELIKGLIEVGVLDNSLTEKEIVSRFEQFFDFEINSYNQTKTKIRGRAKDNTKFIREIDKSLENWILIND